MKATLDHLRSTLPYRAMQMKPEPVGFENAPHPDHIPLRVTGGLGDLILALGPAEALSKKYGPLVIYSKFPELGSLFTNILNLDEKVLFESNGFDFIINLNAIAQFQFSNNFNGFKNEKLYDLLLSNRHFLSRDPWPKLAELHPLLDNTLGIEAMKRGLNRYSVTYASLGLDKPEPFRRSLDMPRLFKAPYITVHDGFDANMPHAGGRAMKTWDMQHWKDLIIQINQEFPHHTVIQIGGPRSRIIPYADVSCVGTFSFERSLGVLQHSALHIDGESGLVHAAHVLGTPSVVLFGPTPVDFFGYPDNFNIAPKYCSGCWWLTADWMQKCPSGYELPECMQSITPDHVITEVRRALV